ncbi:hypothetical protein C8J48_2204 [Desmospora activa DSM 45169]|uniref:Uncharacterized protein n=1 Tax=Desmospora activa DSM 45169 TaxID=1121389 RepID=A0A2T4ZCG0_9BACL|nr:hypothetical protein C8J48_2204 [Desmospora activa DSM 45169]
MTNKSKVTLQALEKWAQKKSVQRKQSMGTMEEDDAPTYVDNYEWYFYHGGELVGICKQCNLHTAREGHRYGWGRSFCLGCKIL